MRQVMRERRGRQREEAEEAMFPRHRPFRPSVSRQQEANEQPARQHAAGSPIRPVLPHTARNILGRCIVEVRIVEVVGNILGSGRVWFFDVDFGIGIDGGPHDPSSPGWCPTPAG